MRLLFLWLFVWCAQAFADAHLFVYHRFGDDRHPSTNVSLEKLREHFIYFKERGYKVVPLQKVVERIYAKEPIPDTWVVLTIDDNYKSFYDNGLALFKEFGYPFTLFVYTGATEQKYGDYSTWEELREIAKYGELEFHSHNHPYMTQLSDKALKKDFETGLALFEKHLGKKPRYFTYPYGEYDARVKAIAAAYGFEAIINQNMGAVSHRSDPLNLDRSALGEMPAALNTPEKSTITREAGPKVFETQNPSMDKYTINDIWDPSGARSRNEEVIKGQVIS